MKRLLLASVAVAALCALMPSRARAQAAVVCVSCPTEVQEALREVKRLAEYGKMIAQGKALVDEAVYMGQAVIGVRDLGSAVGALQVLGIQNPLPINPYAMQNLLRGTGGAQGMLGSLSTLYTGATSNNQVYTPTLRSWLGEQINRNALGIAGNQATSMQLYQSAAQRVPEVALLQARIAMAADPATRESLIAQLGAVQAIIQNQQIQATAVQSFGIQQAALREQQREEYLHMQIDAQLAEGRARGWY